MSEESQPENTQNGDVNRPTTTVSPLLVLISALVGVEALALIAGALYFLSRIFLETPQNLMGAVVIFVITALIAVGVSIAAVAVGRAKPWTRGAIVTWQILQFAVATSFIQGITVWQPVGWGLAALSLLVVVLLFLPATTAAFTRANAKKV
ncbi:ABC-type multidrug transport system permease subunit [Aurantimicrobium minutum]|uniref:hypothetical protein n=1 Tax=Aurantimicrobium minutum TaxID=708131 RepID=UPI002472FDB6|nr:hypothetical protein [Aurantimicrobium minutum]MDH6531787.1 ABC-type multidrug transport system permease subunit [Aurantimicrobium minutum]